MDRGYQVSPELLAVIPELPTDLSEGATIKASIVQARQRCSSASTRWDRVAGFHTLREVLVDPDGLEKVTTREQIPAVRLPTIRPGSRWHRGGKRSMPGAHADQVTLVANSTFVSQVQASALLQATVRHGPRVGAAREHARAGTVDYPGPGDLRDALCVDARPAGTAGRLQARRRPSRRTPQLTRRWPRSSSGWPKRCKPWLSRNGPPRRCHAAPS